MGFFVPVNVVSAMTGSFIHNKFLISKSIVKYYTHNPFNREKPNKKVIIGKFPCVKSRLYLIKLMGFFAIYDFDSEYNKKHLYKNTSNIFYDAFLYSFLLYYEVQGTSISIHKPRF